MSASSSLSSVIVSSSELLLERIFEQYRRTVNWANNGATQQELDETEERLSLPLPIRLRQLLARWSGASFFREQLYLRSASEIAPVSRLATSVIAFADGSDGVRWAFAAKRPLEVELRNLTSIENFSEDWLIGCWDSEHHQFEPVFASVERWLEVEIELLERKVLSSLERWHHRFERSDLGALKCPGIKVERAPSTISQLIVQPHRESMEKLLETFDSSALWIALAQDRAANGVDASSVAEAMLEGIERISIPSSYPSMLHPKTESVLNWVEQLIGSTKGEASLIWEMLNQRLDQFQLSELTEQRLTSSDQAWLCVMVELQAHWLVYQHKSSIAIHYLSTSINTYAGLIEPCKEYDRLRLLLFSLQLAGGQHAFAERGLQALISQGSSLADTSQHLLACLATRRREPWALDMLFEQIDDCSADQRCERWSVAGEYYAHFRDLEHAATCVERLAELGSDAAFAKLRLESIIAIHQKHFGIAVQKLENALDVAQTRKDHASIAFWSGELHAKIGATEQAKLDFDRALRLFSQQESALEHMETLGRMVQLGLSDGVIEALNLAKELELPVWVSDLNSINGSTSSFWHLDRVREHARRRLRAQRALPPLSRADAAQPERRIACHRLAFAACSERELEEMSSLMLAAEQEMWHAPVLTSSSSYAQFVASMELVSAHNSYQVAEVFLKLLEQNTCVGAAKRALISLLSRTRNMGIVDGLLKLISSDLPNAGKIVAVEVMGWRREKSSIKSLLTLLKSTTSRALERTIIVALGRIGDERALPALFEKLEEDDCFSIEVSLALLLLGEWKGIDLLAQSLLSGAGLMDAGHLVGRYGGASYYLLLLQAAQKKDEHSLSAIQGLGYHGDIRAIPILVELCASRQSNVARAASQALELITGHFESVDEYLLRNRWNAWIEKNTERFVHGCRYRSGQPINPGQMIAQLSNDDALVRLAAYDELVISTGKQLPFDPDGPWHVQQVQLRRWKAWWAENKATYPVGKWIFQGRNV